MQLVEPGPQPAPFDVDYSVLEADRTDSGASHETETLPVENAAAPVVDEKPVAAAEPALIEDRGGKHDEVTEPKQSGNTQTPDDFGAGVHVEEPSTPIDASSAASGTEPSGSSSAESAGESEDGAERKKGRRPNRRRRSRRRQKKNNDSDASGDT